MSVHDVLNISQSFQLLRIFLYKRIGFLAGCCFFVGVLGAAPSPTPNRKEIEFTQKGLIFKVLLLKLSGQQEIGKAMLAFNVLGSQALVNIQKVFLILKIEDANFCICFLNLTFFNSFINNKIEDGFFSILVHQSKIIFDILQFSELIRIVISRHNYSDVS